MSLKQTTSVNQRTLNSSYCCCSYQEPENVDVPSLQEPELTSVRQPSLVPREMECGLRSARPNSGVPTTSQRTSSRGWSLVSYLICTWCVVMESGLISPCLVQGQAASSGSTDCLAPCHASTLLSVAITRHYWFITQLPCSWLLASSLSLRPVLSLLSWLLVTLKIQSHFCISAVAYS
ncbi:hypothetical protein RRG08_049168 [Elysia crispata]|uniref:Uncharacterized protein n=1 Tax=Elysia crispata TaxID=231223 RepID=A0AAE1ARI6_9GAST|nr:hypothetical protein RRG08_049168 [Elysia crispata]